MADIAPALVGETPDDLKARLSRALFELNLKLASCKSGALVQASWAMRGKHDPS
jgi:hypothetical protein